MDTIAVIIIILITLYALIITWLLYDQYQNHEKYMKDKVDYINTKVVELEQRERIVSGREVCDRELTRLKTIHKSALDVLNSYNQMTV